MRAHSIDRRWWVSPCSASRRKSSAWRVANPFPSPDAGARPSRSHEAQSATGAAPSHCVDDDAVPHQNPSGKARPQPSSLVVVVSGRVVEVPPPPPDVVLVLPPPPPPPPPPCVVVVFSWVVGVFGGMVSRGFVVGAGRS